MGQMRFLNNKSTFVVSVLTFMKGLSERSHKFWLVFYDVHNIPKIHTKSHNTVVLEIIYLMKSPTDYRRQTDIQIDEP